MPEPSAPLPSALDAERHEIDAGSAGRLSFYAGAPPGAGAVPLLLVHSVNAAASAYEVKPLFDRLRAERPVYALDLPGYGFSERSPRRYTLRLMTDAVLAATAEIARRHGGAAIDAMGVSLSCEFVARAASERPAAYRRLGLVSPTGLDRVEPRHGPAGANRGQAWLYAALASAPWSGAVFRGLTKPSVIRFFLAKTWGSKDIDEGLLAYDVVTTRQPGASHAPFDFVSGFLFAADIGSVYDTLALPVWVLHGTRGDFTDYRGLARYAGRANWHVDVLPTGALPYFEDPAGSVARWRAFSATAETTAAAG